MGSTFVRIRDRGLWMRDGMLELWLRFVALHVEEPDGPNHVARKIRDQWLLASRYSFGGCCPHGIDDAVSTPEGEKVTRDAIHSLMRSLKIVSPTISNEAFNLLGMTESKADAFVKGEFETWRLVEVCEVMLDLIDGKVGGDAGAHLPMPGSGEARLDRADFQPKRLF